MTLPVLLRLLKYTVVAALWVGVSIQGAQAEERYASIVVDAETNEVLHARFADDSRYPASLTKVMTLYMLFDALKSGSISIHDQLPVSRFADSQPASDLGLRAGATISVEEAIYALITKSANDVAVVVSERLGGSEERFAALMTVKAHQLGLASTRFYNASGLPDERQVTTARDMSRLAEALLEEHGDYYHYFANERFTWKRTTYKNHNRLLETVPGVDGIKTGYTRASGFNLMTSAIRDGRRIIVVMLGGNSARARNTHVTQLVEAAYTALDSVPQMEQELQPALNTQIAFSSVENQPLTISGGPAATAEGDTDIAEGASISLPLEE
ncbi:MAG: D-alanyl-D-alanine carboxypeptidase family protein [Pseudomonadota bacterium]